MYYSSVFRDASIDPGNTDQAKRAFKHELGHLFAIDEQPASNGSIMEQVSGTCGHPDSGPSPTVTSADAMSAVSCIAASQSTQFGALPPPPPPVYYYPGPSTTYQCITTFDTTYYYSSSDGETWSFDGSMIDNISTVCY